MKQKHCVIDAWVVVKTIDTYWLCSGTSEKRELPVSVPQGTVGQIYNVFDDGDVDVSFNNSTRSTINRKCLKRFKG